MVFRTHRHVDWGDCDVAGIVFYPNYFRWMDAAFHEMTATLGFDQRTLPDHGLFATPLLAASASFVLPVRFGTTLELAVSILRFGQSSFGVGYSFSDGSRAVAEGQEDRICVRQEDSGKIGKAPMPKAIRALLERFHE